FALSGYPDALDAYRRGFEAAYAAGDEKLQAEMLRRIGVARRALGDFAEAFEADRQSLAIAEKIHDITGQIAVTSGMGIYFARIGDLTRAAEMFERLGKLGEENSDRRAARLSRENLGNIYMMQGDADLAVAYLEKSLALAQEDGASK